LKIFTQYSGEQLLQKVFKHFGKTFMNRFSEYQTTDYLRDYSTPDQQEGKTLD
jgi:hypothetical protein